MKKLKKRDWIFLIAGTALMAIGAEGFFEHASLVAGGITGIGIMLNAWASANYGIQIPLWLANFVGNIPLFFIAWKWKGKMFVSRSILTASLFSVMLYVEKLFPLYSEDPLLAAVFGGAALGVGLGLVLSVEATTGGVELAATLIHMKVPILSVPRLIFLLDAVIILAGIGLFGVERGLYAILAVFVTDRFIDWVLKGPDYIKGAWIFSERNTEIAKVLFTELGKEATVFSAAEKYGGKKKDVLFCVFSQKEIYTAKRIIYAIDQTAFFLVTDIRNILGDESTNQ